VEDKHSFEFYYSGLEQCSLSYVSMLVPKFCGPLHGGKPREKGRGLDENGKAWEKFVSLCFGVECAQGKNQ
jgi:hypothetical protein